MTWNCCNLQSWRCRQRICLIVKSQHSSQIKNNVHRQFSMIITMMWSLLKMQRSRKICDYKHMRHWNFENWIWWQLISVCWFLSLSISQILLQALSLLRQLSNQSYKITKSISWLSILVQNLSKRENRVKRSSNSFSDSIKVAIAIIAFSWTSMSCWDQMLLQSRFTVKQIIAAIAIIRSSVSRKNKMLLKWS